MTVCVLLAHLYIEWHALITRQSIKVIHIRIWCEVHRQFLCTYTSVTKTVCGIKECSSKSNRNLFGHFPLKAISRESDVGRAVLQETAQSPISCTVIYVNNHPIIFKASLWCNIYQNNSHKTHTTFLPHFSRTGRGQKCLNTHNNSWFVW